MARVEVQEHAYRHVSIHLPMDHRLPAYQRQYPLYDRFLPHLAARLPAGSTVVDVGANCGDTLASMLDANPALDFVCIEPDPQFFKFLEHNIKRLRGHAPDAAIRTVRALAGRAVSGVKLEGGGGTMRAVADGGAAGLAARPLDDLLAEAPHGPISLIKVDVDGYDYDVLDSATATLARHRPLLYFECQLDSADQKAAYEATLARLAAAGYGPWVAFDNFGNMMLKTTDAAQIGQLLDYVWRQIQGKATRTIGYLDVLAVPAERADGLAALLAGYAGSESG